MKDELPPHSPENEAAVLGCVLLDNDSLPLITRRLHSRLAFYDLRHQVIFDAMCALDREHVAVDSLTLHQWLKDHDRLKNCGGQEYLASLADAAHSAANLDYWLTIVLEKYHLRKIISTCTDVASRAQSHVGPLDDLKFSVQTDLADLFALNGAGGLPEIIDASTFLTNPLPPPIELVEGLLHKTSKLALGGSSKAFKTWILLDLAFSVAHGIPWLGFPCQKGKVLFLNFEIQPQPWQRRIAAVARAKEVELEPGAIQLWNLRGYAADFRTLVPKIIERARNEDFVLDILDPIYKLYGATDENAAGDVAALLNTIEHLAVETGASVGYGSHFAKGDASLKEAIDRISGSGVFARDPDSLIIFTAHEEPDCFTVDCILRNFPPVAPFVVRWQFPLMMRAAELDPADIKKSAGRKPQHDPLKLLAVIADRTVSNPITFSEWADLAGLPRKTLSNYTVNMRLKGWLRTVGSGTHAKQFITPLGLAQFTNENTEDSLGENQLPPID